MGTTGHGDNCAVRCEERDLLTVGDQDYSAELGSSSAVLGQPNTAASPGQDSEHYHPRPANNIVDDKPCPPGPICVVPSLPSSVPPSNIATASQYASITVSNLSATQLTSQPRTHSDTDTTIELLLPGMINQYQDQDCTGGFCGGWENFDHVTQVSP